MTDYVYIARRQHDGRTTHKKVCSCLSRAKTEAVSMTTLKSTADSPEWVQPERSKWLLENVSDRRVTVDVCRYRLYGGGSL